MSAAIPWDVLEDQYFSDDVYREEIRKMVTIIDGVSDFTIFREFYIRILSMVPGEICRLLNSVSLRNLSFFPGCV